MTLAAALHALNEAAYAAAKAARAEGSPISAELRMIALRTDELVDGCAHKTSVAPSSSLVAAGQPRVSRSSSQAPGAPQSQRAR